MSADASTAARLAVLEDERAIERLKFAYTEALDSGYDRDAIAAVFTAEARWVADGFGEFAGREAILDFFAGLSRSVVRARHYATSPRIDLAADGQSAAARWNLLCLSTVKAREDPGAELNVVEAGGYHDRLVKVEGRWLFVEIAADVDIATRLGPP